MKLFWIHQNHLILNHWSGPFFSPHFFTVERGSLKIVCECQCLEVFPCSPSLAALVNSDEPPAALTACVSFSCTVTHSHAAVRTHTKPFMHSTHYTTIHFNTFLLLHTHTLSLSFWGSYVAGRWKKGQHAKYESNYWPHNLLFIFLSQLIWDKSLTTDLTNKKPSEKGWLHLIPCIYSKSLLHVWHYYFFPCVAVDLWLFSSMSEENKGVKLVFQTHLET